ncbi:MAG: sugar kinase [Candidatus Dadabacteria bacterium]|nr:MAG: sugar kinase [Candidatus Dadabacteria bacterium]
MSASVCVVGSVALDSIETPFGRVEEVLGGSCSYFSVAASFFAPVNMVAVVGTDFPEEERRFLAERGINLEGLTVAEGRTFRWRGRYHEDMNVRDTLDLQLNVFGDFRPQLPEAYRTSEFVFLANIQPGLQAAVLSQFESVRLVGADTMDHWIREEREALLDLLRRVDLLSINDSEALLLSGERNVVAAARRILEMGPSTLLIKRGEYGALQFAADDVFAVPAFPLETVVDPTGAGDCFAGALFGSLAAAGTVNRASLRRAIVHGSVLASFAVEGFGLERLRALTREEVEQRYRQFMALTDFHTWD